VSVSRRRFLEMGSLLAASSVAIPLEAASQKAAVDLNIEEQAQVVSLNYWTLASMKQYVGTKFVVQDTPKTTLTLTLTSVTALTQSSKTRALSGFTMQFRNSSTRRIKQDTYTMVHHNLGTFKLFIVPAANGASYTAVINHIAAA